MSVVRSLLFLAAITVVLIFGGFAQAGPVSIQVGDALKFYDGGYGTTNGGPFKVDILGKGDSPYDFLTFCIEKDEYIAYNTTFFVAGLSNVASNGGVNTNSGDPLDPKTAYLYYKFATGTLADFSYTSHSDADLLQNLIWSLEQEQVWTATGKAVAWLDDATNNAGGSLWGVRVLNLTDANGNLRQDQLVYVPEPTTLLLLGGGLIGVFAFNRKQKR